MLKLPITYTNPFTEEEVTEEYYFNLTKAELIELELTTEGGYSGFLTAIAKEEDKGKMIEIFKDLILRAYGERSPDGKRFMKSKEISEEFAQTEAYSELFMKLATEDEAAVNFCNQIMPASLVDSTKAVAERRLPRGTRIVDDVPVAPGTDEPDYAALLNEMNDVEDSPEPDKEPITAKQAAHMQGRLNKQQFDHFMSTRFIVD